MDDIRDKRLQSAPISCLSAPLPFRPFHCKSCSGVAQSGMVSCLIKFASLALNIWCPSTTHIRPWKAASDSPRLDGCLRNPLPLSRSLSSLLLPHEVKSNKAMSQRHTVGVTEPVFDCGFACYSDMAGNRNRWVKSLAWSDGGKGWEDEDLVEGIRHPCLASITDVKIHKVKPFIWGHVLVVLTGAQNEMWLFGDSLLIASVFLNFYKKKCLLRLQ